MQNRRNYYRVLHVQPDAPAEIIRTSYRTLMQRLRMHPDLGGDQWNAALINEAFATLSDPASRAAYDLGLRPPGAAGSAAAKTGPPRDPAAGQAPETSTALVRYGSGVGSCAFCGTTHSVRDNAVPGASCMSCGSPLYPATRLQTEDHSKRAMDRMPRHMTIEFCVSWPATRVFTGATHDVSISGMRFSSGLELVPGERLRIDCEFCSAVGLVRSSRHTPTDTPVTWQIGVEFLTLLIKQTRGSFVSRAY